MPRNSRPRKVDSPAGPTRSHFSRPIWKGTVSFGLVNIPVELHTAVRDHRPRLRLLHASDKSPVRYQRVCEREGRSVAWADLVKGYEYEKGRYVVLTPDDFRAAALEKSKTIEIVDFVNAKEVDGRYFETPYYLLPVPGAERAYGLLSRAISKSGKMGIGKIVFREAQHLAGLTSLKDTLVLTLMRFADEVVDVSRFKPASSGEVKPKELELAEALIQSLSGPWKPEKYSDEFQNNLIRVIDAKVKGKKPALEDAEAPRGPKVVDLMERLKRSLEEQAPAKTAPRRRPKAKKKASRRSVA